MENQNQKNNGKMLLKKASRKSVKIKMMISGPSGSGKTYSALLLASGMVDWKKIAVIDTERGSADLYSSLGAYQTLTLESPFTPERYIEAINTCVAAGVEVIIIDSITHEWDGKGGVLDIHSNMAGNSFTNWNKLTPMHNKFIDAILQCPVHVICTARTKQDYVLVDKNGKQVPEKVGLKSITREGFDYEVTIAFELDIKHNATCVKDRTKLFMDRFSSVITENEGKTILDWCNSGIDVKSKVETYIDKFAVVKNAEELNNISNEIANDLTLSDFEKDVLRTEFTKSKYFENFKKLKKAKKPAEEKPAENVPVENKPAEMKPAQSQTSNEEILAEVRRMISNASSTQEIASIQGFMETVGLSEKEINNFNVWIRIQEGRIKNAQLSGDVPFPEEKKIKKGAEQNV